MTSHDGEEVENSKHYDVVIVGAGAAGIGVSIALQHRFGMRIIQYTGI